MHEFSYCAFVQLNLTTDHLAACDDNSCSEDVDNSWYTSGPSRIICKSPASKIFLFACRTLVTVLSIPAVNQIVVSMNMDYEP